MCEPDKIVSSVNECRIVSVVFSVYEQLYEAYVRCSQLWSHTSVTPLNLVKCNTQQAAHSY